MSKVTGNAERQAKLRKRRREARAKLDAKAAEKGWRRVEGYMYVSPPPENPEDIGFAEGDDAMFFSLDGQLLGQWWANGKL